MSGTEMLTLRNISVQYGDVQVLWDVSLNAERAEVLAILGSTGAGKSTVMNSISAIAPVFAG